MKLNCHVLSVATNGDKILITGQGVAAGDADWRPYNRVEFEIADVPKNARAFYIGRKFSITIEPK